MNTNTAINEKRTKKLASSSLNLKEYGMVIALVAIFIFFSILTKNKIMAPMNFNNLVMQNSYVVILAVGMILCVLTGNVDLSVGSVVAFIGGLSAIMVLDWHLPIWVSIVSALVIGAIVGAFQGAFIAYVKIPAFIVTLAGMLIFRGLTLVILNGQTKGPLPAQFTKMGAGYLPQWFVNAGGTKLEMISIIVGIVASLVLVYMEYRSRANKIKYGFHVVPVWQSALKLAIVMFILNFFTYKLASYKGLPVVLLILVILIVVYSFITQNTVSGRHIYAVGGNAKAAMLSGIKIQRVLFWVYVNMGMLCGLAGVILSARNASATPKAGDGFELDAMAACYIGGASTTGGVGKVVGAVVGALIMGILNNGMSLLGLSVDWQRVVKGLVLLFAVTFDLYTKSKSRQ